MGNQFGVLLDDRDRRGADPMSYGTLRGSDLHTQGETDRRVAVADAVLRNSCSRG